VVWNTVTAGEQFFLNDFEITKLETTTPEYQYHLKDHLGNVRLSFTSKDETVNETATYETANQNTEQSQFVRYQTAKRINSSLFDRTNGAAPGFAQRLNGSTNERYGIAKSISVMPGDVINAEVFVKYVDPVSSNWNSALTTLMGQIAASTAGVVVDGSSYTTSTSSFPYAGLLTTTTTGAPRAYLNWLVFDRNFGFITGGFRQMGSGAKETGTDVAHEMLTLPAAITITQPGYVYIYLSNESPTLVDVFFDDFKVTHTKSPVIQAEEYYPFGLTFNSYSRENQLGNDYLYNGKEEQDELGLAWLDYGARMYMSETRRWAAVDKHTESYFSVSPYLAFANNPTLITDPTGKDILFWQFKSDGEGGGKWENVAYDKLDKKVKQAIQNFAKTKDGKAFLSQFANKGDKIGSIKFSEDGKYAKHNLNLGEFSNSIGAEGYTGEPIGRSLNGPPELGEPPPGYVDFYVNLYSQMDNDSEVNYAETLGHEVFLHLNQYVDEFINAFDRFGQLAANNVYKNYDQGNSNGDRDHKSMYQKTGGSRKYYEYINQLKGVLNPESVEKHVENERKKYKHLEM